jgi:hypothetical protein
MTLGIECGRQCPRYPLARLLESWSAILSVAHVAKSLNGWQARQNYFRPRATGHRAPAFECDSCAQYFGSETARFQHMEALNHFEWECSMCDETWPTDNRRIKHKRDDHNHCSECRRTFANSNLFEMVRLAPNPSQPDMTDHLVTASQLPYSSRPTDPVSVLQETPCNGHRPHTPRRNRVLPERRWPDPRHALQVRAQQRPQRHYYEEPDWLVRLNAV